MSCRNLWPKQMCPVFGEAMFAHVSSGGQGGEDKTNFPSVSHSSQQHQLKTSETPPKKPPKHRPPKHRADVPRMVFGCSDAFRAMSKRRLCSASKAKSLQSASVGTPRLSNNGDGHGTTSGRSQTGGWTAPSECRMFLSGNLLDLFKEPEKTPRNIPTRGVTHRESKESPFCIEPQFFSFGIHSTTQLPTSPLNPISGDRIRPHVHYQGQHPSAKIETPTSVTPKQATR